MCVQPVELTVFDVSELGGGALAALTPASSATTLYLYNCSTVPIVSVSVNGTALPGHMAALPPGAATGVPISVALTESGFQLAVQFGGNSPWTAQSQVAGSNVWCFTNGFCLGGFDGAMRVIATVAIQRQ